MAGDLRNGTLIQSRAWGYTDGTAEVTDAFVYGGLGGAVSNKTTTVTLAGASTPGFSQSFAGAFTWTSLGLPASVTYPTCPSCTNAPGRTVYYGYTNGRLTSVGPYYVQAVTYHPNGLFNEVTHTRRGVEAVSGVKDLQTIAATSMPRPASLGTDGVTLSGTGADGDWSSGAFGYDGVGNILTMGTDTFTYDRVSRLTSAKLTSLPGSPTTKKDCYYYDPFANLTAQARYNYNPTCPSAPASLVDPATNRLTSAGYDAAGNLLSHTGGAYTYTFDALNQLVRAVSLGVHRLADFDGGGERVLVRQPFATPAVTVTVRGLDGKVLRDVSFDGATWRWVKDWVYREGVAVASVGEGEGIRHGHRDHLGSLRMVTNRCGEKVLGTRSWPYGEEIGVSAGTPQAASERLRFTGHERDFGLGDRTGDDLDSMHARSYAPTLARFLSVDPGRDTHPTIPQSWNLYSYVRNNPMGNADPTGRDVTIVISRDTYTANAVTSTIVVTSTVKAAGEFSGFALETTAAGDKGDKDPIPPGSYNAFVRADHSPNRIELKDVPGFSNIQVHMGNDRNDVKGCFAVGKKRQEDKVEESLEALRAILKVIENDKTNIINVLVNGSSTKEEDKHGSEPR